MAKDPKALAILLDKAGPAKPAGEPDGDEMPGGGGTMAAAKGIMDALKNDDAAALASELRNFVELCGSSNEE